MSKVIAVLGVTGAQGGSIAQSFLKLPDWTVRGITRSPSSANAQKLAKQGVQIVKADLDDASSLEAVFEGANAVYAVTDFWQFVQDPATQKSAESEGISLNEASFLREVQQGKNIIDAAARVGTSKLERMVFSSLADTRAISKGKYQWPYHFEGKGKIVQYLADEAEMDPKYKSLWERTSYIQVGNYLDNWKKNPVFTPYKQEDGTIVFRVLTSKVDSPVPFVHPPTDIGPCVKALVLTAPPRTIILATCSMISYPEFVKLWGETLGVKSTYRVISIEETEQFLPGKFGTEVAESAMFAAEYGWDGGMGAKVPWDAGVDRGELTDIVEYIKNEDWSAILA